MSKIHRVSLLLITAVFALVLVVVIGRNVIIHFAVSPMVRSLTGFDASMGSVRVGLLSSKVSIRDLKVTNPPEFEDRRMLTAPVISVEYRLLSLFSRRKEFPRLQIHVSEVVVVKNQHGETNLARILASRSENTREAGGAHSADHFGEVDFTLGRVIFVDYSKRMDGKPLTKEVILNLQRTRRDVTNTNLKQVILQEVVAFLPVKLGDLATEPSHPMR